MKNEIIEQLKEKRDRSNITIYLLLHTGTGILTSETSLRQCIFLIKEKNKKNLVLSL
jgi:hypothetical protein